MRALVVLAVFALLAIGALVPPAASQTTDAWIGTWTLNLAQSSYDPATLAVDDHHYSYSTKVKGAITTTSRVAVTPDGKTRTITTTGRDAQGRVIRNFAVWNRVG